MSDIRARLVDALREHEPFRINVDGGWIGCSCDGGFSRFTAAAHRSHLADVLLSLPGIAIVALPEPHSTRYEGDEHEPMDRICWMPGDEFEVSVWDQGEVQRHGDGCGDGEPLSIAEARIIAAVLLAAARAAEQESSRCPGCGSTDPDRVHYAHCPKVGQH